MYIKKLPKDIEIGEIVSIIGKHLVRKVEHPLNDPPFFIFAFEDYFLYPRSDEELYIYKED